MTGMMAQTGSLGQPLLIPLSMAGSIAGQGGLAVLTLPTTNVASLPAFAAANAAGNLLKLPFAGLQGKPFTKVSQRVVISYLANSFKKCCICVMSKLISLLSCYSPELGSAPTARKYTDDVPAPNSFCTASAVCCAAGDLPANTDNHSAGHCRSVSSSPGDPSYHHRLSVQHIRGSSPNCRTLHQSCHCK